MIACPRCGTDLAVPAAGRCGCCGLAWRAAPHAVASSFLVLLLGVVVGVAAVFLTMRQ